MKLDIIAENKALRLNVSWLLLFCFALPSPANLGMANFFALPVDDGLMHLFSYSARLAIGYALAIIFMIFLPRYVVWAARLAISFGLVAALAMFLPLNPSLMALIFIFQNCCGIIILVLEVSIAVSLFSKEAAIKACIMRYVLTAAILILSYNGIIPISFTIFRIALVLASVFWLYFYFTMPIKIWPSYASKGDGLVKPRRLFLGIYILMPFYAVLLAGWLSIGGKTGLAVIAIGLHEQGFAALHLSVLFCSVALYALWKLARINPFHTMAVLVSLGTLGFASIILVAYIPALALVSCILMGASVPVVGMMIYSAIILTERYPSKFIVPIMFVSIFIGIQLQSLLAAALQDNIQFLYAMYLFVAIVLAILYFMLLPYLIYALHEKPQMPIQQVAELGDKASNLAAHAFDKLAAYEIRIAELILQGYTNPEMAAIMNTTTNTVKSYRKSLYSKLQIHSRQELFGLAEKDTQKLI